MYTGSPQKCTHTLPADGSTAASFFQTEGTGIHNCSQCVCIFGTPGTDRPTSRCPFQESLTGDGGQEVPLPPACCLQAGEPGQPAWNAV